MCIVVVVLSGIPASGKSSIAAQCMKLLQGATVQVTPHLALQLSPIGLNFDEIELKIKQ